MTDVVEFGKNSFLQAAKQFKAAAPAVKTGGGGDFLKLSQDDGSWSYGREETVVEDGAEIAVNTATFRQGYIAWHLRKVEGERMATIGQDPINEADLGPVSAKNGWEEQIGFDCAITTGEDSGVQLKYNSATMGGKGAYNTLFDAVMARAGTGKPHNPIVTLSSYSYPAPSGGYNWVPVFTVVKWFGDEETAQVEDLTEEVVPEEAAPPKRRRKAAE